MKTNKRTIFSIAFVFLTTLVIIIGIVCTNATAATKEVWYKQIALNNNSKDSFNAHDYSSIDEQIKSTDPSERNKILALSEKEMNTMSTEELLVTCLDYPLFGYIIFYDNLTTGFKSISNRYNGLKELMSREDIGSVLLDFYSSVDYDNVLKTDKYGCLRLKYLELLMASDDILFSLSSETRQKLLSVCMEKLTDAIENYKDIINPMTTTLVIGKILYMESPEFNNFANSEPIILNYLNGIGACEITDDLWDKLVTCIKSYIN